MKRPKPFWLSRDELHNLRFFVNIYRNAVSSIRSRTSTQFKCCPLLFDRITCKNVQITIAEVVNSVDYESASYMLRYI